MNPGLFDNLSEEKPAPVLDPQTIDRAVDVLRGRIDSKLDDGIRCPCCDKYVKRYRRKFNASMARSLIWLVREWQAGRHTAGWIDVPNSAPRWLLRTNQLPTVRWWGLIERADNEDETVKHSGWWRPTRKGELFAEHRIMIPKTAITYNGEVTGFDDELCWVDECLGVKFNYSDLMGFDDGTN